MSCITPIASALIQQRMDGVAARLSVQQPTGYSSHAVREVALHVAGWTKTVDGVAGEPHPMRRWSWAPRGDTQPPMASCLDPTSTPKPVFASSTAAGDVPSRWRVVCSAGLPVLVARDGREARSDRAMACRRRLRCSPKPSQLPPCGLRATGSWRARPGLPGRREQAIRMTMPDALIHRSPFTCSLSWVPGLQARPNRRRRP